MDCGRRILVTTLTKKIIVCLDSNVYISALGFGGNPLKAVGLALNREFELVTSQHILNETSKNLKKIGLRENEIEEFVTDIFEVAECFSPTGSVALAPDPDDNLVIETALMGFAKILVTGDKEILELGRVGDLHIESVSTFLKRFQRS